MVCRRVVIDALKKFIGLMGGVLVTTCPNLAEDIAKIVIGLMRWGSLIENAFLIRRAAFL